MTGRIIKFRVWDHMLQQYINWNGNIPFDSREYDVEQFVGCQDKNGTDIYEGDIVQWSVRPLWLRYDYEFAEWEAKGKPLQDIVWTVEYQGAVIKPFAPSDWMPYNDPKTCKVIGNVHQNPEN